jgi:LmbE family N-acetylglucosaminyl deacetylase/FMN phosphatase YigB (HAD superfamily)/predicted  nucleic acid-binding Zn-ribbon protein
VLAFILQCAIATPLAQADGSAEPRTRIEISTLKPSFSSFMQSSEQDFLPYAAISSLGPGPALVFAPHPDDEVFGCGGAIMRHVSSGDPVRVVIVTDGAYGSPADSEEYARTRRRESAQAAAILGYGVPEFWNLPDRGLEYGERLIRRLLAAMEEGAAELVYAPSCWEIHPDHRVLALAAAEAARRSARPIRLAMYEVGVPLQPNALLDITGLAERKAAAVACFSSQLAQQNYDKQLAALNRFRTYTLPRNVHAAEGYLVLSAEELRNGIPGVMARKDPLAVRGETGETARAPLVSVIIRSMGREQLKEALDSVALQTYPHIEVVVIDAKGEGHAPLEPWCGRFPLRLISLGQPLLRSRAANIGLEQARGDYLIFLDDDDLFYPDHISNLVKTLKTHRKSRCAYAGVKVEFYTDGRLTGETAFNQPYLHEKLRGRNFIPIHAALFHRSLVDRGCRFDETLDRLEDWDFWLQIAEYTRFIHIDKISACYRNQGESGLGERLDPEVLNRTTAAVFEKWKSRWSGKQWAEVLLYRDTQWEQAAQWAQGLEARIERQNGELTQLRQALVEKDHDLEQLHRQNEELVPLRSRLAGLQSELAGRESELAGLQNELADRESEVAGLQSELAGRESELAARNDELADRESEVAGLQSELAGRESELAARNDELADRESELKHLRLRMAALDDELTQLRQSFENLAAIHRQTQSDLAATTEWAQQLQAHRISLLHSTSWRTTAPLRFGSRLLRGRYREAWDSLRRQLRPLGRVVYRSLPEGSATRLVNLSYRHFGTLFAGFDDYERWRRKPALPVEWTPSHEESQRGDGLVDIRTVAPLPAAPPGRVAIHAHIYYSDLAPEMAHHLAQIPFRFDLFVSVASSADAARCRKALATLPELNRLTIEVVQNRGRDIAPMFCAFGDALRHYDFIAHIHSKKSLYNNGATDGWREYLLHALFGSSDQIRRIFALLSGNGRPAAGLVYPQNFRKLPYFANTWLANRPLGQHWCGKLGIGSIPKGYFSFPTGTMFWGRREVLRPLFEAGIALDDFAEEAGQTDGTLAHCLERVIALAARQSGFDSAILADDAAPSWSPWRFDQYLGRRPEDLRAAVASGDVHAVIFDIFDTLLVRPLLDPESAKAIVASRTNPETGNTYLKFRAQAEHIARTKAGRDVGLDEIFEQLAVISGLPRDSIAELRRLEETVECGSVTPRPDTVECLRHALARGKRVILASDMYLPRPAIESMLKDNGIDGWHALYLSSDTGRRKDTGETYRQIISREGIKPENFLMIGDNEHSDLQIPSDLGLKYWHVLRPVELARALPRVRRLIDETRAAQDLHREIALGLMVQTQFRPLFFSRFDPRWLVPATPQAIGYGVLGPVALAFAQWLTKKAAEDRIQRFYFLSREGQFLKMVYDRWTACLPSPTPSSHYLVLSRRSVTVPAIRSRADIDDIARKPYFPNQITVFLNERYGLEFNDRELSKLNRLWPYDKPLSVTDGDITKLAPVLRKLKRNILSQARKERPGLLAYLTSMGLDQPISSAVVDIGYSATIQDRLNKLLDNEMHGYYLATDKNAANVSARHGVIAQGCYAHHADSESNVSAVYRMSFQLEKLLSADDPQVVRYHLDAAGQLTAEQRPLCTEELATRPLRAELRRGAMDFVTDAIAIRHKLMDDFTIPIEQASHIYAAFVENSSPSEDEIIRSLVLDDHYCGRGLVS